MMTRRQPPSTSPRAPSNQFTLLTSLRITHDYFNADGETCRAIEVRPSPQTVLRLKQHRMAVVARDDGFDLLASHGVPSGGHTRSGPAQGRPVEPPLLFTMRLRDSTFTQYTDMPVDVLPGEPPLRWSNRGIAETGDRAGLIAPDWSATAGDPAPGAGGEAGAERAAYAKGWREFGLFDLALRLPGPGGEGPAPSDLLSTALADPGFEPPRYELRFAARRTTWRYIVAAREGGLVEDSLEIVDASGAGGGPPQRGAFKRLADRRQLPDGRVAVVFAGRSAVPLRQKAEHRYALRGLPLGGHMRPRTLVDPLPAPSPRATVFDVAARSTAPSNGSRRPAAPWSDIYVFV